MLGFARLFVVKIVCKLPVDVCIRWEAFCQVVVPAFQSRPLKIVFDGNFWYSWVYCIKERGIWQSTEFICIALLALQMPSTRNTDAPTSACSTPKTTPTCYVQRTELRRHELYIAGARSTRLPSNPGFRNTSSPPLREKPGTLIFTHLCVMPYWE